MGLVWAGLDGEKFGEKPLVDDDRLDTSEGSH